jgi:hypothetical protein
LREQPLLKIVPMPLEVVATDAEAERRDLGLLPRQNRRSPLVELQVPSED